MHFISICECLCRIIVGASRHQEITSKRMDHWILGLYQYQFLEIQEGLRSFTNQICTLASKEICIVEFIIKFYYFGEISNSLLEHR